MGIVVSEKFYIGFQNRVRYEGEKPHWREQDTRSSTTYRLGFATYLEDNAPFRNRQETITRWSQPYKDVFREDPTSRQAYWNPETRERANGHMDRIQIPELQPEIIDNVLLEGFRIPEEIKRYGWNGGNVVWRIEDPRGFELEIPSPNLAQILLHCTIENGVIQGSCIWGWDMKGAKVVLLPENSEPYQKAMTHTSVRGTKVKASDVQLGDSVQLKNEIVGTYLGRWNMLFRDYDEDNVVGSYNPNKIIVKRLTLRSCFLIEKGCGDQRSLALYLVSEPKFSNIKEKTETPVKPERAIAIINEFLQGPTDKVDSPQGMYHNDVPVLAFLKKPKQEDFELDLVPLKRTFRSIIDAQDDTSYDSPRGILFSKINDDAMMATELGWNNFLDCFNRYDKRTVKERAQQGEVLSRQGIFSSKEKNFGIVYRNSRRYWYHASHEQGDFITDANTREWLQPVIKFEGKEYPLIYIPETKDAG